MNDACDVRMRSHGAYGCMSRLTPLQKEKRLPLADAVERRRTLANLGLKLVLTNGCFDLLHAGHHYFLREAARLGDVLWVALNGDRSIRLLKGAGRPIQPEEERASALASLCCVGGVITFQGKRLVEEISVLTPDVYVKGGDYDLGTINVEERAALNAVNAEIRFLPILEGFSTTSLVDRLKQSAPDS